MKFKYFPAPVLFSSTFNVLNLGAKIQELSRMRGNPEVKMQLAMFTDGNRTEPEINRNPHFYTNQNRTLMQKE